MGARRTLRVVPRALRIVARRTLTTHPPFPQGARQGQLCSPACRGLVADHEFDPRGLVSLPLTAVTYAARLLHAVGWSAA